MKIVTVTLALMLLPISHSYAQEWGGCGIVSYSSPSTPGYMQGGGPSGFNVGDLPDEDPDEDAVPDSPPVILPEVPSSNNIAYGPCIYTDSIDKATSSYDADDSGALHKSDDADVPAP